MSDLLGRTLGHYRIVAYLDHPSILTIYDFGTESEFGFCARIIRKRG